MSQVAIARDVPSAAARPAVGYILSPRIDFWLTGGASLVVMSALLVYIVLHGVAASDNKAALLSGVLVFQVLINWPHFMGAYSLLYRPQGNIKKYAMAAIYVPLALLLVVVASVLVADQTHGGGIAVDQDIGYLFWLAAAFYLAWHYTGQAWGMIATFARLSSLTLAAGERTTLRLGLRSLLVWHVVWGAQDLPAKWLGVLHGLIPQLLLVMNAVCIVALLIGTGVWVNVYRRHARAIDARVLAPWLAVYSWYLVLYFMPQAYPIVQFSHALQYLAFPLRVELNRAAPPSGARKRFNPVRWSVGYYLALMITGVVAFYVPEYFSDTTQTYTLALMIASAISIHHYFVDGCIWKISNADVRKALLAHLAPSSPARG